MQSCSLQYATGLALWQPPWQDNDMCFRAFLLVAGQKHGTQSSTWHHTGVGYPVSHWHCVHTVQLSGKNIHLQGIVTYLNYVELRTYCWQVFFFGGGGLCSCLLFYVSFLQWSDCDLWLLQGAQYWRFENDVLDSGYPKPVATGFDGLRGHITAALSVPQYQSRRESVYFFKRGKELNKSELHMDIDVAFVKDYT